MQRSEIRPPAPKVGTEGTRPARSRSSAGARKRIEIARYISEITAEMSKMAGGADMPMLVYFLNLARVEAETLTREGETAEKPADQ
jgi:hypothetical protein